MILRDTHSGQKLDVAGLNEITVLIDRSETERSEVAINRWQPGLDGPPHQHEHKEQIFLVLAGEGDVLVGNQRFSASVGSLFYLPAGVVHQTITRGDSPLEYFLFNAFLDAEKEGHASFAEHIAKVKHIRRRQADTQQAESAGNGSTPTTSSRIGIHAQVSSEKTGRTVLLSPADTESCDAILIALPDNGAAQIAASTPWERTLHVLAGSGSVQFADETASFGAGQTLFIPRGSAATLRAGQDGLRVVSFGAAVK
ncbi:MAG: cupin domain-containing protein [Opitutaceae bacterium]|nr:cupin domain-containing protein [Opitutaceae bacterium]